MNKPANRIWHRVCLTLLGVSIAVLVPWFVIDGSTGLSQANNGQLTLVDSQKLAEKLAVEQSPKNRVEATVHDPSENVSATKPPATLKKGVHPASFDIGSSTSLVRELGQAQPQPYMMKKDSRLILWWGKVPENISNTKLDSGTHTHSNVRLQDYSGAKSCKQCHEEKYEAWIGHSHRLMNADATSEVVMGDFSEGASIEYIGGRGTFFREGEKYRMQLERDGVKRIFAINRTIGSRFQQYYVGKLIEGPEQKDHDLWKLDHVLPFGYWLDKELWVPIVNVHGERPDNDRFDPFELGSQIVYDRRCSQCHVTRPVGDLLMIPDMMRRFDQYSPRLLHFFAEGYLAENHPKLIGELSNSPELSLEQMVKTFYKVRDLPAEGNSAALGVSCEACHNGSKEHAQNPNIMPRFFPVSPHVNVGGAGPELTWGKQPHNLNWTCSRCHSGRRPTFAAGMSTWNSTEYSDATKGACFDMTKASHSGMDYLTCVKCHEPHSGIGKKWSRSPSEDDAKCVSCHTQYQSDAAVEAHTHHPLTSEGSRCMNCHMPRINEGMQDVVRTHTIFSPTEPKMLAANHPNACNLCHLEQPIDWTLKHLASWYDWQPPDNFEEKLAVNYPLRQGPVGSGWMESPHHSTRLVAADAAARENARWAIPGILDVMDDPFLLNRQFASDGLEKMLNIELSDYGYIFYMFKDERRDPLEKLRAALLKEGDSVDQETVPANVKNESKGTKLNK